MCPKALDFQEMKEKAFAQMRAAKQCVLATAAGDAVTARQVNPVCVGNKLYFNTSIPTRKYQQITENPKVAIVIDNLQIEGTARPVGHPGDPGNKEYLSVWTKRLEDDFPPETVAYSLKLYAKPEVPFQVIEVTPRRFQLYHMPPDFYMDIIDLEEGTAVRFDNDDTPWDRI